MAMPTVQEAAAKYGRNAGAAASDWAAGAARFEGDPTALAAAAGQKALTNYQAAWQGRIQRGLAKSGRSGWLAGVNNPGAQTAYTNGVQNKGAAKWSAAMNTWFPIFNNLSAQIDNMPRNTPQDSINRVAAWINGTIAAKQNL